MTLLPSFRLELGWTCLLALLFALGCSEAAAPTAPALPETVTLRVDRVEVSATKPGTVDRWDGQASEPNRAACAFLGAAVGLATTVPIFGKGSELLCVGESTSATERDQQDPDLEVRVSAGTGATYVSRTARDVRAEVFGYEIAVPTAAIPADGLRIEIADDDGEDGAQLIGAVRISAADLARALSSPTHLLVVADTAVKRLELVVAAYVPARFGPTSMPAQEGLHSAAARAVFAGEVVRLAASGSYTVGTWYDQALNPMGYPAERARGYNFEQEPFHSAPHACGVATVGALDKLQGEVIRPSLTFMARVPGPLRFGINDNDPGNNNGSLVFEGTTRAPTAEEWLGQAAKAGK